MAQPVVHVEITGPDPDGLQEFYRRLFGWEYDTGNEVSRTIEKEHGSYGFVRRLGTDLQGGVGGGAAFGRHVLVYVAVPDVAAALAEVERLGGRKVLDAARSPRTDLVIAQFEDPAGNLMGLTETA
ncbi:VOC family protein [Amnibacterium sp. CER49]|uniref:VOC family protein n=1 Tax=Amnibacterium sp. CER49 TaxID=3039161 RepID=UPI00244C74DA|nr:VOC family protein [Amnibacterium sp. CER49]MDH2442924.1 VOC family protein [Amnibacterium sp. CER49]